MTLNFRCQLLRSQNVGPMLAPRAAPCSVAAVALYVSVCAVLSAVCAGSGLAVPHLSFCVASPAPDSHWSVCAQGAYLWSWTPSLSIFFQWHLLGGALPFCGELHEWSAAYHHPERPSDRAPRLCWSFPTRPTSALPIMSFCACVP
eukprot:733169-Prymnesium_polylepis.1